MEWIRKVLWVVLTVRVYLSGTHPNDTLLPNLGNFFWFLMIFFYVFVTSTIVTLVFGYIIDSDILLTSTWLSKESHRQVLPWKFSWKFLNEKYKLPSILYVLVTSFNLLYLFFNRYWGSTLTTTKTTYRKFWIIIINYINTYTYIICVFVYTVL